MRAEGLVPYSILCYSLKHLTQTEKVKFFYALKGRGKSPGILTTYNITQLSKGVLLVSQASLKQTHDFLAFWKCSVTETKIYKDEGSAKKS